jgi:hypothetical protein
MPDAPLFTPNAPQTRKIATSIVAAFALAAGQSYEEAAQQAGVNKTTVWRWMRQPAYRERVSQIRDDLLSEAAGQWVKTMTAILSEELELIKSKADHHDRRLAFEICEAILDRALKLHDAINLEDRIQLLEAREAQRQEAAAAPGSPEQGQPAPDDVGTAIIEATPQPPPPELPPPPGSAPES